MSKIHKRVSEIRTGNTPNFILDGPFDKMSFLSQKIGKMVKNGQKMAEIKNPFKFL